jgi:hypothetical protein
MTTHYVERQPPWVEFPNVWKTEAEWWSYLRGVLRRGWTHCPIKVEFIKKNRKRIMNEKGREIWGGKCAICQAEFPSKSLNVDHIEDAGSLKSMGDISPFVQGLFMCGNANFQYVCTGCHKIKNHASKRGISMKEAEYEKRAIAIQKEKKDVAYLESCDITAGKSIKARRTQLIKLFSNA